MDIIMLKEVEKVGDANEIVKVKDGYARNYLIPQKLAVVANDSNRRSLASKLRALDKKENARLSEYNDIVAKVGGKTLKMTVKAGTSGRIFGSVNAAQVSAALHEQFGVTVDRKKIVLEDIKEIGDHTATLNLHKEVSTTVIVHVAAEGAVEAVAEATEAVAEA
jgi:large subunit ribosomal protein L9